MQEKKEDPVLHRIQYDLNSVNKELVYLRKLKKILEHKESYILIKAGTRLFERTCFVGGCVFFLQRGLKRFPILKTSLSLLIIGRSLLHEITEIEELLTFFKEHSLSITKQCENFWTEEKQELLEEQYQYLKKSNFPYKQA